ncbi:MAG: glycosyltransferase, partial [Actinomycetota bacterium]
GGHGGGDARILERIFLPDAPPDPLIVSVGRLESDKDPDLLLDAFALARTEMPDLRLQLIGDGPDRERIAARAGHRDFSRSVIVESALTRTAVAERLREARVFALGSRVETFCVAAAEAMASGVPVVMPRIGPMPELVDGSSGVLVDTRDPAAMAEALLLALRGGFDAGAMASRIAARFSDEAVGRRLADVYSEVAG